MGLDAMGYGVNKRAQWEKKDKNCSFLTNQNKKPWKVERVPSYAIKD